MAATAVLDFQVCEFGHSGVLIVWYLCSVSNLVQISVIVTEIDALILQSDLHLMTSRELTSGFDIWSRGHLRMAVMHFPIKFGAYIFIQSGVIDFLEIQDGVFIVWYLCSLPNLVKISIIVTEIDALILHTFI